MLLWLATCFRNLPELRRQTLCISPILDRSMAQIVNHRSQLEDRGRVLSCHLGRWTSAARPGLVTILVDLVRNRCKSS
jgi:hypothetical protein